LFRRRRRLFLVCAELPLPIQLHSEQPEDRQQHHASQQRQRPVAGDELAALRPIGCRFAPGGTAADSTSEPTFLVRKSAARRRYWGRGGTGTAPGTGQGPPTGVQPFGDLSVQELT